MLATLLTVALSTMPATTDRDAEAALALALARFQAKPVAVRPAPPPRTRPAPVQVAPVRTPGWHTHRCVCGNVWSHGSDQNGNVAAHTCGRCGRVQWHKAEAPRLFEAPRSAATFCPT